MVDYTIIGIGMVIIGVLLILIGGGTAIGGMNKMDAAEDWEPPERDQGTCTTSINTSGNKSFKQQANDAISDCPETSTLENPYSGGERDVAFGVVLVVFGGLSTYFGNKM